MRVSEPPGIGHFGAGPAGQRSRIGCPLYGDSFRPPRFAAGRVRLAEITPTHSAISIEGDARCFARRRWKNDDSQLYEARIKPTSIVIIRPGAGRWDAYLEAMPGGGSRPKPLQPRALPHFGWSGSTRQGPPFSVRRGQFGAYRQAERGVVFADRAALNRERTPEPDWRGAC